MPSSYPSESKPPLQVEWEVDEPLQGLVDQTLLESVLAEVVAGRRLDQPLAVGLRVTDDRGIRELNRRYRGMDRPTDVLSFPLQDYEGPERPMPSFPLPPGESLPLGDLVISYERAVEQAKAFGHPLERELAYLVVHGAMHLLGYDHEKPEDAERMRREEETVLQRLNLGRQTGDE